MLNYYNIPFNFNHDNLDDTKILHFVDHMQKKYITHWKHSLCNSQKLEFYNVFKDSYILYQSILMLLTDVTGFTMTGALMPDKIYFTQ